MNNGTKTLGYSKAVKEYGTTAIQKKFKAKKFLTTKCINTLTNRMLKDYETVEHDVLAKKFICKGKKQGNAKKTGDTGKHREVIYRMPMDIYICDELKKGSRSISGWMGELGALHPRSAVLMEGIWNKDILQACVDYGVEQGWLKTYTHINILMDYTEWLDALKGHMQTTLSNLEAHGIIEIKTSYMGVIPQYEFDKNGNRKRKMKDGKQVTKRETLTKEQQAQAEQIREDLMIEMGLKPTDISKGKRWTEKAIEFRNELEHRLSKQIVHVDRPELFKELENGKKVKIANAETRPMGMTYFYEKMDISLKRKTGDGDSITKDNRVETFLKKKYPNEMALYEKNPKEYIKNVEKDFRIKRMEYLLIKSTERELYYKEKLNLIKQIDTVHRTTFYGIEFPVTQFTKNESMMTDAELEFKALVSNDGYINAMKGILNFFEPEGYCHKTMNSTAKKEFRDIVNGLIKKNKNKDMELHIQGQRNIIEDAEKKYSDEIEKALNDYYNPDENTMLINELSTEQIELVRKVQGLIENHNMDIDDYVEMIENVGGTLPINKKYLYINFKQ